MADEAGPLLETTDKASPLLETTDKSAPLLETTDKAAPLLESTHLQNEAEAMAKLNKDRNDYLKPFTIPLRQERVIFQFSKDS